MRFYLLAVASLCASAMALALGPAVPAGELTGSPTPLSLSASEDAADDTSLRLHGQVTREGTAPEEALPGQTDDAARSRLQALITKTGTSEWERLFQLGRQAYNESRYQEAQRYYLSAIRELKKTNQKDERLIKTRNNLGEAYLATASYYDAENTFRLARETEKELSMQSGAEAGRTLRGLAAVYKGTGNFARAERVYKEALQLREQAFGPKSQAVGDVLLDLAELYRQQKLYSEAGPAYQLALETLDQAKDVTEVKKADALQKAGLFFYDQGKLDQASKFISAALTIKDNLSTPYAQVEPGKLGFVQYVCLEGTPNSYHAFTRGVEAEFINIKDVSLLATLTAQEFDPTWIVLKAHVTVTNRGKTPVSAMRIAPELRVDSPRTRRYGPLVSDAIARRLVTVGGARAQRILHSADYRYIADSITTVAFVPLFAHLTPDWQARIDARNAAIRYMANSISAADTISAYKPEETTIGPGETATFLIYFPYVRFDACTLRLVLGNTLIEFPFTARRG